MKRPFVIAALAIAAAVAVGIGAIRLRRLRHAREIADHTATLVRELRTACVPGLRMRFHDGDAVTRPCEVDGPPELTAGTALSRALLEAMPPVDLPPESIAAIAATYVYTHDVARALAVAEPAAARTPDSVDLATVTASAYLLRAAPGDRVRALDAVEAALAQHPADVRLRFDVAAIGQRLLPAREARDAWTRYREAETDERWRAFARPFEAPIGVVHPSSDEARADLLDRALPAWAESCAAGGSDIADRRAAIAAIASAPEFGDDRYAAALVPGPGPRGCRAQVARAFLRFVRARALYRSDKLSEAEPIFRDVVATLGAEAAPIALHARLFAATAGYFGGHRQEAKAEFDAVARAAHDRGYFELAGRSEWMRGYARDDELDYEPAVAAYEAAHDAFTRANSTDGVASADGLMATAFDWLGQYDASWRRRETALARLGDMTDSRGRDTILTGAIRAASREGLRHAALRFATAKLREDANRVSATRRAQALLELGELQLATGQRDLALGTLAEAERPIAEAGSDAARARLRARLESVRASAEPDPAKAALLLKDAIDLYQKTGADIALARLLLARARAELKSGATSDAEADLRAGIAIVERARSGLTRGDLRLSYLDDVWDLFDELLEMEVSRGAFDAALAVADRARGRVLRESRTADAAVAMTRSTAPQAITVYYLVLRDRLVTWVFGAGTTTTDVQPVPRTRLAALVEQFRGCTMSAAVSQTCDSTALSTLLVSPVLAKAPAATQWTVVPDPVLQPLPFAAMRHPRTGRYLVEDVTVSFAPSLAPIDRPVHRDGSSGQALIVGNPASSEGLAPLPRAADEARAIASRYAQPTLLVGPDASRARFLGAVGEADVIHFAGHAVIDPEVPSLSRLALAPGAEPRGNVYAHEILSHPLGRSPIVILAACETAVGRTYRSEGVVSLARAFMQAGARDVVATLWRIDDEASAALFVALHDALRGGDRPAQALRRAQLAMLGGSDLRLRPPAAWAAVIHWTTTASAEQETRR